MYFRDCPLIYLKHKYEFTTEWQIPYLYLRLNFATMTHSSGYLNVCFDNKFQQICSQNVDFRESLKVIHRKHTFLQRAGAKKDIKIV